MRQPGAGPGVESESHKEARRADRETAKLAFTFTVNGSDRLEAGTGLADVSRGSTLDLEDGATYDVSRDIIAYDAPDHLRIVTRE